MKLLIRLHMPHYSAFHDCIQRNNQLFCDKFIKSFYLIFEYILLNDAVHLDSSSLLRKWIVRLNGFTGFKKGRSIRFISTPIRI